jgi:hypothetical protein
MGKVWAMQTALNISQVAFEIWLGFFLKKGGDNKTLLAGVIFHLFISYLPSNNISPAM